MGNLYDMFWSFIALSYHLHDIAFENSAMGKKGSPFSPTFYSGEALSPFGANELLAYFIFSNRICVSNKPFIFLSISSSLASILVCMTDNSLVHLLYIPLWCIIAFIYSSLCLSRIVCSSNNESIRAIKTTTIRGATILPTPYRNAYTS